MPRAPAYIPVVFGHKSAFEVKRRRIVRGIGSIDDGGIRAFVPLTQTLLISPPESVKT
jgi:hypothetical protein